MVSIGFKALPLRKHKSHNLSQDSFMVADDRHSRDDIGKKRKMGRKGNKENTGFHRNESTGGRSGGIPGANGRPRNFAQDKAGSVSEASFIRKQVDPETTKYFSEIANVIEGTEIDMEERSVVCGNALEEARGKEVELATDYIISHTMQILLEGCSLDNLCSFLQSCAKKFSQIAMDRSGSHVAETALKSLAGHLEDYENHSLIEETLSALCEAIVANPVDIMCNCYGSHVLRRLLCLCKGVPIDSLESRSTNPSAVLAERLNLRSSQMDGHESQQNQPFPDQLKFLVSEMLNPSRADIAVLQANQSSSLVLQTALKLLAGQEELFHVIPVLLGCSTDNASEGGFIEMKAVKKILRVVEENAYSHLMEVILAVAPDTIYNEIFTKVFKDSLFRLSQHPSGNFVVQALVAHARDQDHIKLIFEGLGSKFRNLLELGRSGVVAALIAASQRLHTHEQKCCQALADAVCSRDESSSCIVPRLLFLDNYFYYDDKANWNWPYGFKMHVLGSLILQSVFRYPSEFIQAYITSITSLEDNHVLEASKDPAGARVIEAFLISNASAKQKHKIVIKLRGHFGELSLLPSGSFTVEKCFSVSNMSLKETIVSEVLPFESELSKTKQGPYLLKTLDVEGFARRPDQWRSGQTSKQSAYNEFYAAFGSKDVKSSRSENFLSDTHHKSQTENLKVMRKEIDSRLSSGFSSNSGTPFLAHQGSAKHKKSGNKQTKGRGFPEDDDNLFKRPKTSKGSSSAMNTNDGEILRDEKLSSTKNERKRHRKDGLSKSTDKKLRGGVSD